MNERCKDCRKMRPKLLVRYRVGSDGSNRGIYADDTGRWWNGRQCPTCKSEANLGRKHVPVYREALTDRKCRVCGKALPRTHYFAHEGCRPEAGWDMTETYADRRLG
jgi:hypothetical protein